MTYRFVRHRVHVPLRDRAAALALVHAAYEAHVISRYVFGVASVHIEGDVNELQPVLHGLFTLHEKKKILKASPSGHGS